MSTYRPPQQQLAARVFTGAGWLEGTFHLAQKHAFPEYLAHHTWYPLTDVVMAKLGTLPFLALAREETFVVAPQSEAPALSEGYVSTKATLLMPGGAIDGVIELAPGLRLSDLVTRSAGFLLVKQANVRVWADAGAHYFEWLLVNPQRLVGVTEPEQPT